MLTARGFLLARERAAYHSSEQEGKQWAGILPDLAPRVVAVLGTAATSAGASWNTEALQKGHGGRREDYGKEAMQHHHGGTIRTDIDATL